MKRIIFSSILILLSNFLSAQYFARPPYEELDSLFDSRATSSEDWIFSITIDQPGAIPLFGEDGEIAHKLILGTYVFASFKKSKVLERLPDPYFNDSSLFANIPGKVTFLKNEIGKINLHSLAQMSDEYIYPFIYKDDSLKVFNLQEPPQHGAFYGIYVKSSEISFTRYLHESLFLKTHKYFKFRNLNYEHNINTLTYAIFKTLIGLVEMYTSSKILW